MRSKSIKQCIFDASLFTYTLALIAYFIRPLNEDQATSQMTSILELGLGVFLVCLIVSIALSMRRVKTVGAFLFTSSRQTQGLSFYTLHLGLVLILTLIVSWQVTEFSFRELTDPEGLAGALRLYTGLTHANLQILPTALVQVTQTVFVAFLATVLALPFAFLLAFLSAKNIMTHPAALAVYAVLRALLNIVRSVEPLIWALIFTVWVGIGPFAGMLALMIHSVAALAKQYSEVIEDVAPGPLEGIRSTGANTLQTIFFGMVPQVLLPFISFTIYRWDTNVRMATIIGLVGGGGIGTLLIKYQGQAQWPEVGCIIFVIAGAVWLMDAASAYIRDALR